MNQYRITLLGEDGRELSCGYLFSGDDDKACASAERLLLSNAEALAVQVRQGDRLVCSYERA